jgi:hypothetical protein
MHGDGPKVDREYVKPTVVDFGSLLDLTAANGVTDTEDGLGKVINTDGSTGFLVN